MRKFARDAVKQHLDARILTAMTLHMHIDASIMSSLASAVLRRRIALLGEDADKSLILFADGHTSPMYASREKRIKNIPRQ